MGWGRTLWGVGEAVMGGSRKVDWMVGKERVVHCMI